MPTHKPTTPATSHTATANLGPTVFSRTMPFMYERHAFGEHKKTSMARVEVTTEATETKPDKSYLSLQKRLIESPALNAIRQCDARFRDFLKNEAAMPWRPGLYLVPLKMVERLDERAQAWEKERAELADAAAAIYEQQVAEMPKKLGPLFNPQDYPSRDRFRATFWVSWRFVDMGTPNVLQTLKAEVFERERKKVEAEAQKAVALIQQHLRTSLYDITTHLASLLAPKADGKFKALRDNALDDLTRFLDTIALRDVTNDHALQAAVKTLRALGKGTFEDVDVLKDDTELRKRVAVVMEQVKGNLETLVVERTRGIKFRDEEE